MVLQAKKGKVPKDRSWKACKVPINLNNLILLK